MADPFALEIPSVDTLRGEELGPAIMWIEPRPKRWNHQERLYNCLVRHDGTLAQCVVSAEYLGTVLFGGAP